MLDIVSTPRSGLQLKVFIAEGNGTPQGGGAAFLAKYHKDIKRVPDMMTQ
jgi:hypothetical protein